ncbi:MAG: LL-diaminopimelate aminotransferase, partial [Gemmatimonadetes bacterium]|nr:LL-diaminopimelate aminotransferase [Gemmatimonadota bacterium]
PYLWVATPDGQDSWSYFDHLLDKAHIVGTPGAGFGAAGEGYLRLSAFNHRDRIEEAMERISLL